MDTARDRIMDEAQDRLFELIFRKMDDIHTDVKANHQVVLDHINEDRELAKEVWFVKRAFQVTWGGMAMLLAYLGVKNS
jgi:hypothetical protein